MPLETRSRNPVILLRRKLLMSSIMEILIKCYRKKATYTVQQLHPERLLHHLFLSQKFLNYLLQQPVMEEQSGYPYKPACYKGALKQEFPRCKVKGSKRENLSKQLDSTEICKCSRKKRWNY